MLVGFWRSSCCGIEHAYSDYSPLCRLWMDNAYLQGSPRPEASLGPRLAPQNQCSVHMPVSFHLLKRLTTGPISDKAIVLDS